MSVSRRPVALLCLLAAASLGPALHAAGLDDPLIEAVKQTGADAEGPGRIGSLLDEGADPDATDASGATALHWAVELDQSRAVDLLLRAGADPAAATRHGVRPLTLAARNGHAGIVGRLLAAGADPNTTAPGGETALMTAARTGRVDVVHALLAAGAEVGARETARRQTALMWAAAEGHAAVIQTLIEAGADVDARSGDPDPATDRQPGEPPPLADYFVRSNGGPLNAPMRIMSMSPLMFAVRAGHFEAARALLDGGADVNETADNGLGNLVLAIINAHYELAAFLLDRGADPNAAGQGWTALHQVATTPRLSYGRFPRPHPTGRMSPLELAELLIERGADVNARMTVVTTGDGYRTRFNRLGATPFVLAAKGIYPDMMRLLLEHGADPHLPTAEGTTALMLAAGVAVFNEGDDAGTEEESLEAVRLCVEHGADVNQVDDNGETALHGAAYRGFDSVVRYLADEGARLDVENRIGWTPLTIADGVHYTEFFKAHRDTAALLRDLMRERGVPVEDVGIVTQDPRRDRRR